MKKTKRTTVPPWERALKLKEERFMSLTDVAERMTAGGCSVSKGGVSEILHGRRWQATWKRIEVLARALGIQPRDLF